MIRSSLAWVLRKYVYHTPSHPGRGFVGKIAHRLGGGPVIAEVSPGVRFAIRLDSVEDINYWTGRYETQGEVGCFRTLLKPGMTVFDVGANKGLYSLTAGRDVGPTGKVYGFEPMPPVMARLREHISLNQLANVTSVPCAVCDRVGTAEFFPDESGFGTGTGSLIRPDGQSTLRVETTTVDEFKRRNGIGKVSVVKIDVEGAEPLVLDGMRETLQTDRPVLLVEHNDAALRRQGSSAVALFDRIIDHGYRAFWIKGGRMVPVTTLQPPLYPAPEPTSNYIFTPAE